MPTIQIDQQCKSCEGTGLYIGMAERDGAAIVCHTCKGEGHHLFYHEYTEFQGLRLSLEIKHVYQTNPGITVGIPFEEFGGMSYKDWQSGKEFPPKSENRKYVCPTQWYQQGDCKEKPNWNECRGGCRFFDCSHFDNKSECWERWDKENEDD